ncbi:MAG: hypothetical protein LBL31_05025 [Spirochaetaceae bacterium]|jgi:hypothetical protein|nr:hypothetical protein [Spirochaetaceae bacterium]
MRTKGYFFGLSALLTLAALLAMGLVLTGCDVQKTFGTGAESSENEVELNASTGDINVNGKDADMFWQGNAPVINGNTADFNALGSDKDFNALGSDKDFNIQGRDKDFNALGSDKDFNIQGRDKDFNALGNDPKDPDIQGRDKDFYALERDKDVNYQ